MCVVCIVVFVDDCWLFVVGCWWWCVGRWFVAGGCECCWLLFVGIVFLLLLVVCCWLLLFGVSCVLCLSFNVCCPVCFVGDSGVMARVVLFAVL